MKRAALYLVGSLAVVILLITAQLSGVPTFDSAPWQPDDGGSQGYIVEWYADSLLTASAPGRPLRLITAETLSEAMIGNEEKVIYSPALSSGSSLLDAAWHMSVNRLSTAPLTPYNILIAPLLAVNGHDASVAARLFIRGNGAPHRSWPLADSNRLLRIMALSRLAVTTGADNWLGSAIAFASETLDTDSARLFLSEYGLWGGGGDNSLSGAMPEWATLSDRFRTASLAINALAADAYGALATMQRLAGADGSRASNNSKALALSINDRLWIPVEGFYSQYLYGRLQLIQGPSLSGMGNAIAASSPLIATDEMARRVVKGLPRTPYGITRSFPLPYGSSSVDVPITDQGVWAFACRRAENERALWSALSVLLRAVSLVAIGDLPDVPEVWGAYAGAIAGIIFGLEPTPDGLSINPVVPTELAGEKKLSGLPYRNAILDISISGSGTRAASIMLDGENLPDGIVPPDLTGRHTIRVEMMTSSAVDLPAIPVTAPSTLYPTPQLSWSSQTEARDTFAFRTELNMARYRNGVRYDDIPAGHALKLPQTGGYSEWLIGAVGDTGLPIGMIAEPHQVIARGTAVLFQAEWFKARELSREVYRRMLRRWRTLMKRKRTDEASKPNFRLTQIVELSSSDELTFTAEVPIETDCVLIFGYADGRDAGNPGVKLRSVSVNGKRIASVLMPQSGNPADTTVTLQTGPLKARLVSGMNNITLSTTRADKSPFSPTDTVMIDYLRIIPLD